MKRRPMLPLLASIAVLGLAPALLAADGPRSRDLGVPFDGTPGTTWVEESGLLEGPVMITSSTTSTAST